MKDSARDEKIGRLLGHVMRTRVPAAPPGACPDAETLAAWSDETLTSSERASVDAHVADCARCQAQLAAMVRMTAAEPMGQTRSSVLSWRWLVPATSAAVAAVAVALWVSVQRGALPASRGEAPAQVRSSASSAPAAPAAEPPASRDETARRDALEKRVDRPAARGGATASAAPLNARAADYEIAGRKPEQDVARERALARPESAGAQREQQSSDVRFRAALPPPAAAPAPAAALAESVSVRPLEIVSPDPAVRWRIRNGSLIERSTDGGTTWGTQTLVTGAQLTAGASPAPSVAWLVGRGGTVMLSTDGATWRRVPFPEAVDLVRVTASSATSASVTTVDGRTFATSDGGATWR